MTFEELKDKALSLPFAPGVYIMRDAGNKVIYVGKAKKLKNRVSQYFQDSAAHTPKTRAMVSKIDHFDVIVAASEFEALVLECSLIKRYLPKYNILLKDDKGYPYLRLDMSEEYPRITVVHKLAHDGAAYFGPYGSWGVTQHVLHTILRTLKLPDCSKQFPRDLGKDRPCLNYHMNQCQGWCQLSRSPADYRAAMEQARLLLTGNYQKLAQELRAQMLEASEELKFDSVTNGASNDIEKATSLARTMITMYGMSEKFGMVQLEGVTGEYLDNRRVLNCSSETETKVDTEVKNMMKASYEKAYKLLKKNMPTLDAIAQVLYEKENLSGKEFMELYEKYQNVKLTEAEKVQ